MGGHVCLFTLDPMLCVTVDDRQNRLFPKNKEIKMQKTCQKYKGGILLIIYYTVFLRFKVNTPTHKHQWLVRDVGVPHYKKVIFSS